MLKLFLAGYKQLQLVEKSFNISIFIIFIISESVKNASEAHKPGAKLKHQNVGYKDFNWKYGKS